MADGLGVGIHGAQISLIGSAAVPRLLPRLGRARTLALAAAWRGLTLGAAGAATSFPLAFTGFMLQEIGFGISEPVLQGWMNEHASAARRATVLSIRSMAFTLGGGTGLIALGWLALRTDIGTAWLVSAAIYVCSIPFYFGLRRGEAAAAPLAVVPAGIACSCPRRIASESCRSSGWRP